MEQSIIRNQYGVNIYLSKIYLERIDEKTDKSQYKYAVEILQGDDDNGNGYCLMKIYTYGVIKELIVGGWRVSPIVKMPYYVERPSNWCGYSDEIDIKDNLGDSYTIELEQPVSPTRFKERDNFAKDVTAVLEKIFSLEGILNVTHLRLEEQICKINEIVNSNHSSYPNYVNKYIEEAKSLCLKLRDYIDKDSKFQELYNMYSLKIIEFENVLYEKYNKKEK